MRLFKRDKVRNHAAVKPRRSWRRRWLIVFNCVLALIIVVGVGGIGYTKWRYGQINKLDLHSVLSQTEDPGGAMNVLLVGSDSREVLSAADQKKFGAQLTGGQRSDTIMILHVDPRAEQASILSIPRDTWVSIAGTSGKAKINSAFDSATVSGPTQLIQTIQQNFNIPIDHYVEVDFDSFRSIVNSIGGVQIPFSAPARDWGYDDATKTTHDISGLNIPVAGCVNLTGDQALSYVRSRHYQMYVGGRWRDDPLSDLGRIQRQQDFIRRVMRKAVSKGSSNPLTLNSLIASGVQNLTIDSGLSLGDMEKLARRFQSLDPGKVQMMTLPTYGQTIDGQDALLPKAPDATQTISRFLGKDQQTSTSSAPASIPAGSISVRVLNGSGVAMQATDTAGSLRTAGFGVSGIGDTPTIPTTTIRYNPDDKDKADVLAKFVEGTVTEVPDASVKGVDAILTTGSSFLGINVPASGTGTVASSTTVATTATTAPANSTTTTVSPFVPDPSISC